MNHIFGRISKIAVRMIEKQEPLHERMMLCLMLLRMQIAQTHQRLVWPGISALRRCPTTGFLPGQTAVGLVSTPISQQYWP